MFNSSQFGRTDESIRAISSSISSSIGTHRIGEGREEGSFSKSDIDDFNAQSFVKTSSVVATMNFNNSADNRPLLKSRLAAASAGIRRSSQTLISLFLRANSVATSSA